MSTQKRDGLLDGFAAVRVISLANRVDRRLSVRNELNKLNVIIDGVRVSFHDACRPAESGGFPTIGARGCFLSHLAVLEEAQRNGSKNLLILEDDVSFSQSERRSLPNVLATLKEMSWDIFYGGSPVPQKQAPLAMLDARQAVLLAHCIAFSSRAIERLVPYLEAMLARPSGSADGGPMHVDGAYSWFRAANPDLLAVAATPPIAHQRSSATDIHELSLVRSFIEKTGLLHLPRTLKNAISNRK